MSMFSVVVVTYNSASTIAACVDSALRTMGPGDELLVVDNASADATLELLAGRSAADPRLRVIASRANLGFSEGTNTGLRAAHGEYLVLLNPDTVVTTGWLARMAAHVESGRPGRVGAVGPVSDFAAHKQHVAEYLRASQRAGASYEDIAALLGRAPGSRGIRTKLLIGYCMMVPRRVFDAVGLLDPELFLGCDDLDLSWRLRLAGYDLVVATDVFVHHDGQVSYRTQPSEVRTRLSQQSFDALGRKLEAHYGRGRVPCPEELWDVDFFYPSWDLWEGRATTFRLDAGLPAEVFDASLSAYLAAFDPADPVALEVAVPAPTPSGIAAEGERIAAWLTASGHDPEAIPDVTVCAAGSPTEAVVLGLSPAPGQPAVARPEPALLRQAAGFSLPPSGAPLIAIVAWLPGSGLEATRACQWIEAHTGEPVELLEVRAADPEAWRAAARRARGEFVAFLEPGARVTPGWLTRLVRPLLADPALMATGPRSNGGGRGQAVAGPPPAVPWQIREFGKDLACAFPGTGAPTRDPVRGALVVRRELAERVVLGEAGWTVAGVPGWLAGDVYVHVPEADLVFQAA